MKSPSLGGRVRSSALFGKLSSGRRRYVVPFVPLFLVLVMAFGPTTVVAQTPPDTSGGDPVLDRRITSQIDVDAALDHLRHFTDVIGPRFGGTPAENQAAEYLKAELESYGYDVVLQGFPASNKNFSTIHVPGERSLQGGRAANGRITGDEFVSAEVVWASTGMTAEEFPANTAGKIVLMENATTNPNRQIQIDNAVAAGAVGAILQRPQATPFDPALTTARDIPIAGVGGGQGTILKDLIDAGPLSISLGTLQLTGLTAYNVHASKAPTVGDDDSPPVLMVSGHYDSVRGAPGANDDGSGTMLTLELARVFKDIKTDKELRFSFWGAEEQGLIGSNYYINNLPAEERARIVGLWQNDMVATSWEPADKYNLLTVHGQHTTVTQAVAAVAPRLGYADLVIGPIVRGGSDHVPFHNAGIAAANHSWRPESGPGNLEPQYHTPEDTIELNISPERWRISMELIGSAVYTHAQTVEDGWDLLNEVVDELELTPDQWKLERFLDRIERELAADDNGRACEATAAYGEEVDRLANLRPERNPLDPDAAYDLRAVTNNLALTLGC